MLCAGTSPRDGCSVLMSLAHKAPPYRIPPTRGDITIADAVAKYASPRTERAAEDLTWAADEHVVLAIAAGWWLYCRRRPPDQRTNSDHLLLTTLVVSAVPHLLKSIFDQRRPDRLTMLRYGVNDLRLFFDGDIRFLSQFQ